MYVHLSVCVGERSVSLPSPFVVSLTVRVVVSKEP